MITGKTTARGYALVIDSLEKLPARVLVAAQIGMARGLNVTVTKVQTQYLQGPRPLKLGEVTTRLRQSINSRADIIGEKTVRGRIGSNVKYAAFHEFGFHGAEHVAAHTRVLERFTGIGAVIGGRALNGRYLASGGKKEAKKQKAGAVGFEYIRAHDRKVDYAGRPFVAPALKDCLPLIIGEVKKEINALTP